MPVEIVTFIFRRAKYNKEGTKVIGDEIIQPWKNIKNLRGYEWLRDPINVVGGDPREIPDATYVAVKEKEPVFLAGYLEPYDHIDMALFQDNNDGQIYEVAVRLAKSKRVKLGDSVSLSLLGCCAITNIIKRKKKRNAL